MGKIIATDLDGTLLYPKKRFKLIDRRYKQLIQRFPGEVVLVTGRGDRFCRRINRRINTKENYVCFNGALVIKNGKTIFKSPMKKLALTRMYYDLLENHDGIDFYLFDDQNNIVLYGNNSKKDMWKSYLRRLYRGGLHSEFFKINKKRLNSLLRNDVAVLKAMVYVSKNIEGIFHYLKKKFGDSFTFHLNERSIEISHLGVSKANALKFLVSEMEQAEDDVLVVGNDFNDISLFENFKNSFVIKDSHALVKSKAKHIIDDFAELELHL